MTKINKKTFRAALKNSGGNQVRIANALEVGRSAVGMYLIKHPEMRKELEEEAELLTDMSEDNIAVEIMVNKNTKLSKWHLANSKRGKSRGYGTKQEVELSGNVSTLTKEEREAEIKRLLEK